MTHPAAEGPASGNAISAGHGYRLAVGRERPGGARWFSALEKLVDGVVRQKRGGTAQAGRADHQAPAGGGIDAAHLFQDVELGNGIGFRTAQDVGEFEAQQARIVESVHRHLGQGGSLFGLRGAGLQRGAHAFHRVHEDAALFGGISGE